MASAAPEDPRRSTASATTLWRSISEGVRTIVTVTERLSDLRTETTALRNDLNRLAEKVYQAVGRLDAIDQRFAEAEKRVELAVKVAVRDEVERRDKD
jgi:predicted  nucleic acid-binding Zn-ribbon protein